VHVGDIYGRPPDTVLDDVNEFISEFRVRIKDLDTMWKMFKDVKTIFTIDRIAKLATWAHGEWVWIHPFANGNGRTARLWVIYVLLRFGLPPIAVRPRPSAPYGLAAVASMKGRDHGLMESVILQLLYEGYQDKIRDYVGLL